MSKLKAFVRFDGTGRIIPSSVILAKSKPKVGNWTETTAYECCNYVPITTTTTTTLDPLCRLFELSNPTGDRAIWSGIDCNGEPYTEGIISGGIPWKVFICKRTVVGLPPYVTLTDLGLCYSCKEFELTSDTYPFTYNYVDCNGDGNSIEIFEPTTICAQSLISDSSNVSYIGPCPN
tara:strand:- start:13 stop:543 length:531 start_codon:yes stop_codon:yes gene_type:complete